MTKTKWKNKIKNACKKAGTYQPFYDETILTLAAILEKRDDAEEEYQESGAQPIIEHTNKSGAVNRIKNPALTLWSELNRDALAYWRDLGLTPAGYKKLNEKQTTGGGFEEMLKGLGS